jgi:DinB family protein
MTDPLREQLVALLKGGNAHVTFEDAVRNFPARLRGVKPPEADHSAWELLEHIRLAQWDILEFCRNPKHVSPAWPEGYWPESAGPANDAAWKKSVSAVQTGSRAMQKLVENPATDLYAKIPGGTGQNILREALLAADHNAYHVGQIVLLRRLLGAWKK